MVNIQWIVDFLKKKLLAKMQRIPSDLTVQLVKEGVFQKNVAHMVN